MPRKIDLTANCKTHSKGGSYYEDRAKRVYELYISGISVKDLAMEYEMCTESICGMIHAHAKVIGLVNKEAK